MKRNYDVGKSTSQIDVGDFVLVKNETRKDCLVSLYKGPFSVLKRTGPNVRIQISGEKEKIVHLNRCRRYFVDFGLLVMRILRR